MPDAKTTLQERRSPKSGDAGPSAQPTIFLVMECERPLAAGARCSLANTYTVTLGRGEARRLVRGDEGRAATGAGAQSLDIRVPDAWMSRQHARLDYAMGAWLLVDLESRNGTFVNGERVAQAELGDGDVIELGHTLFVFRDNLSTPARAPRQVDLEDHHPAEEGMATLRPDVSAAFNDLERLSSSGVEILIRGESGTGKELIARAIHALSGRGGAFVAINCGALPPTLVESELFGYERGAFSGAAHAKSGLIRSAHGGTLFLDEIGDLAAESQTALLRVLQEREVTPVGGTRPVPVDFRLIAATHRDLNERAQTGAFREDLLGRISAHVVHLPPLRDRREDLGVLLATLLPRVARNEPIPAISTEAARLLLGYDWPRNVRQLEKYLAVAAPFAEGGTLEASHLPAEVRGGDRTGEAARSRKTSRPPNARRDGALTDRDRERKRELVALLREHGGNVSAVARAMNKGRTQIQRWVQRYGLDARAFRGP